MRRSNTDTTICHAGLQVGLQISRVGQLQGRLELEQKGVIGQA